MEKNTIELSLLDPEEREQLEFIWNMIPAEDRAGITQDDVLFVLDEVDNYLEDIGLVTYNEMTGEEEYAEGEIDETEQLEFVLDQAKKEKRTLTSVHIQLILDAELQYGIEKGWYAEEDC